MIPAMQVTYASIPAPGHANEDFIATGNNWVAVLDGATPRADIESGCVHDVPWLVAHLAAGLTHALDLEHDVNLDDALAHAIAATMDAHGSTCDLDNPDSPSSTVAILRRSNDGDLDFLVLADSPILIQHLDGTLKVITDERSASLPAYTHETVRAARNTADGFWVASTTTEAARRALTGAVPVSEQQVAALMTDGVSRYVDRLGLGTWDSLLHTLRARGPMAAVGEIRGAERAKLPPVHQESNGRTVKRHDDATAAIIEFQLKDES
jgi:hypothetical protein